MNKKLIMFISYVFPYIGIPLYLNYKENLDFSRKIYKAIIIGFTIEVIVDLIMVNLFNIK